MVYKLSLEQLNDIVSDAVKNAIKNLENVEIVEDVTFIQV
jgi:predicted neutral ceramidase superfamily lipid hydrolase